MMLSKKDFILLKMVFDETLYQAVREQSLEDVNHRLATHYAYELENGFVVEESLTEEDLVEIQQQYEEESKTDDYQWAL